MRLVLRILARFLAALTTGLVGGVWGALTQLWRLLRKQGNPKPSHCIPIDRPEYVRPDPMIYSQYYLQECGFAVTWNNPDIELYRDGALVSSELLEPGVTYEVVATIWNLSPTAPVIQMPVHFAYRDFGVGAPPVPIGTVSVSVGVKGGPGHPALAKVQWTTPVAPGHYCLQAQLDPVDDINLKNNFGQENTNVASTKSPATFQFTLCNDTGRREHYRFEVDAYVIGQQDACRGSESERKRQARLGRHKRGAHPLPDGWSVQVSPDAPLLDPAQSTTISVIVTPPPGFKGRQPVNVNALYGQTLAGGVTLTVAGG